MTAISEMQADVVVVGAGMGGLAAALAAWRWGKSVILTEETDWIGGQLTAQGVPPDEHPWIEYTGAPRSYRRLREGFRAFYRRNYALTEKAYRDPKWNPGGGFVSHMTLEPRVAWMVLNEMLAPALASGRLTLLLEHVPQLAEVDGDRVKAVTLCNRRDQSLKVLRAPCFIDATETGELLPMTGTEYVIGSEAQSDTGEPHATAKADPRNQQSVTWVFGVEYRAGEDHTIAKPKTYDFWREYVPELRPAWTGKLLSWSMTNPVTMAPRQVGFAPEGPLAEGDDINLWEYRRMLCHEHFSRDVYTAEATLVNWPQNDYMLGNIVDVTPEEREKNLEGAIQLSLSLMYWMQTGAPRPDGGTGWKGLRMCGNAMGTLDGLAKSPYIRESRRLKAEFTVLEQHIALEARRQETGLAPEEVTAVAFSDSVGLGAYRIDLHPTTKGENYVDISSLPYQIPLGSLIPERMENLIAGGKNIGTTHITNGCYRTHPAEWSAGEAAGSLAAFALEKGESPRGIRNGALLKEFQQALEKEGVDLRWPKVKYV